MHACMGSRQIHAAVPLRTRAPSNSGANKEPLQVRIPVGVKRRFKAHAALRGIEANELFVEVWEYYERRNPRATTTEGI